MTDANAVAGPSSNFTAPASAADGALAVTADMAAEVPAASTARHAATLASPQANVNFSFGGKRCGIVYAAKMTLHWKATGPESDMDEDTAGEPERPARIRVIWNKLSDHKLLDHCELVKIRLATKEEIMLVHSAGHWDRVEATSLFSTQELVDRSEYYARLSLYANQHTFESARMSCGGVVEMCRSVAEGRVKNGFCIVRPPGHHCDPEDPSGFCFFNNVAVAAKWLRTVYESRVKRLLILDWDVHHGNGTQRAFYDDDSILYISIHRFLANRRQDYFYPGTDWGSPEHVGEERGRGFNVNIAWPDSEMGDRDYLFAFQRVVMPIAMEFNPDFIIVSAGFDAARHDPLGECHVSPEGFAHMTYQLCSLASGNVVLALEGGYHLNSIATSALECVKVLMGETPPQLPAMVASTSATEAVDDVLRIHSKHWKSLPRTVDYEEASKEGKIIPLSDVLRMHRQYDLYYKHGLCTVPIADSRFSSAYKDQIMVSEDVYTCETLAFFVHDLGNVRSETPYATADARIERGYLIDTNSMIVDAVKANGWGLIDVQVLPVPKSITGPQGGLVTTPVNLTKLADQKKTMQLIVDWIWNQFISLAECKNLVFIALGDGCAPITNLVNTRAADVKAKLRASVQLPGLSQIPIIKMKREQPWYNALSLVLVPRAHAMASGGASDGSATLKHGNLIKSAETRPTRVLMAEWPQICEFMRSKVPNTANAGIGRPVGDSAGAEEANSGGEVMELD